MALLLGSLLLFSILFIGILEYVKAEYFRKFLISRFFLPSLYMSQQTISPTFLDQKMNFLASNRDLIRHVKINTSHGSVLDGAELYATGNRKAKKWMVYLNANGTLWEQIIEYMFMYGTSIGVNVFVFNYSGVGESTGFPVTSDILVRDGLAALQYILLEKEVGSKDVLLHGHSLGGAVAAAVRAYYPEGPIVSDRSFSSFNDAVTEFLTRHVIPLSPRFRSFVKYLILRPIVSIILFDNGWNIDPIGLWQTTTGGRIILYHQCDAVIIADNASLYHKINTDDDTETVIIELAAHMPHQRLSFDAHNHTLDRFRREWPVLVGLLVRYLQTNPDPIIPGKDTPSAPRTSLEDIIVEEKLAPDLDN
eukprot:Rmarinus@m.23282